MSARMRSATAAQVADTPARLLREVFGYAEFRGQQREIVEWLIDGHDALVLMPTGGGKSLCYQIPALARPGMAVVVSPLIALMQDQVAALREAGVRAASLNSSMGWAEQQAVERQARAGELELLYVAPERLLSERCLTLLDAMPLALFAIDEAHCVSQWGHDFRPEYIQLGLLGQRFPGVPRVALTATADESTRREILERLQLAAARSFVASFDRPNIRYRIGEKDNPRRQLLQFLQGEHADQSGIVYCLARASCEQVAGFLCTQGIEALAYHAGLDHRVREAHQARFLRQDGLVMVATIAFGMGIDKPDVRFVAHLDLPRSIENYYQETGRAGRDGLPADAWMVYGLADVVQQRRLIEQSEADEPYKRIVMRKLDGILGLCESVQCRRMTLLQYFGEGSAPCGNCDNCLAPPQIWDGTQAARKLMSCIYRCEQGSGFGFGAQHVIDVLRGEASAKVEQFGHRRLSTFGIGAELDSTQWRSVLRQLVMLGLVQVDHAHFNVLRLTAGSREVLAGRRSLSLRRAGAPARRARKGASARKRGLAPISGASQTSSGDRVEGALYESLRAWRLGVAREHGVPAYTVFHDSTLQQIAGQLPGSLEALRTISGVGAAKLERYGPALLALVAEARGAAATAAGSRHGQERQAP